MSYYALLCTGLLLLWSTFGVVTQAQQSATVTDDSYTLYTDRIPQQAVTPVEQSQTVDGVTLTLDWVYADDYLVAVSYHTAWNPDTTPFLPHLVGVDIENDMIGSHETLYRPGGGGNTDTLIRGGIVSRDTIASPMPDQLSLTITIDYRPENDRDSENNSGGGPGSSPDNPPAPETADVPVREFTFNVTVPVIHAVQAVSEPVTQTVNGRTVTLESLHYTPSRLSFRLCYERDDTLLPVIRVDTGLEGDYLLPDGRFISGMGTYFPQSSETRSCVNPSRALAIPTDVDQLLIHVPGFRSDAATTLRRAASVDEAERLMAAAAARLQDEGFTVETALYPADTPVDNNPLELRMVITDTHQGFITITDYPAVYEPFTETVNGQQVNDYVRDYVSTAWTEIEGGAFRFVIPLNTSTE